MPIPNEDVVRQVLAVNDRGINCHRAVEAGWRALKEKHPDVAWWRRKTTRAHIMWENTVDHAIASLVGTPGVRHIPHHDTASFIFDDTVFVRFKLANMGLNTSNYPTSLAKLFHRHDEDLFGFDGHHRVEVVHVLNRFGTALEWIGVVARERNKILWKFELPSGGAIIEELPPRPMTSPAADRVLHPVTPEGNKKADEEGE